jgi:hypothetical protein
VRNLSHQPILFGVKEGGRVMVFNAALNNISVRSWRLFFQIDHESLPQYSEHSINAEELPDCFDSFLYMSLYSIVSSRNV